jgi:hypothetical protein
MNLFKRKSQMDKFTSELATLHARAEQLSKRHATADAAFRDAKAKLQDHLLEADIDADDRPRVKLEALVASCALTRDNYAEALATQGAKICELEAKIATERARVERVAASEKLSNDLDAVEQALPDFFEAARRFAEAMDRVHHHYETVQIAAFLRNTTSQIEVAHAFSVQELRSQVNAVPRRSVRDPAEARARGCRRGRGRAADHDCVHAQECALH